MKKINKFYYDYPIYCYKITTDSSGNFIDESTKKNLNRIVKKYSLMKFGSQIQINFFAKRLANILIKKVKDKNGRLWKNFKHIADKNEHIITFAPGYRNVESSSNMVAQRAIEQFNIYLAKHNLPTIIVVKLTRLQSNQANYATLSKADRENMDKLADHVLPGSELYGFPIHTFFIDDVKVTGATAKKVYANCTKNNGVSISSAYLIEVSKQLSLAPQIEDKLNTFVIGGQLDNNIQNIINHSEFRPVQRLLRLVFSEKNRADLANFARTKLNKSGVQKLLSAAYNNNYHADPKYKDSVKILQYCSNSYLG